MTQLLSDIQVVISTHQTEDLDAMYDHVVILDRGQVRFEGDTDGFLALAAPDTPGGRRAEAAYTQLIAREV